MRSIWPLISCAEAETCSVAEPFSDEAAAIESIVPVTWPAWAAISSVAHEQGDYPAARAHYEESLAIQRRIGDRKGIAGALSNLGNVKFEQGDYLAARAHHEESLAILREIGDRMNIAISLNNLGNVAEARGDYSAARTLHGESLAIQCEIGNRSSVAYGLEGLAQVDEAAGQPDRATILLGAADNLRSVIGAPLPPSKQAEYDVQLTTLRAALGEQTFAPAWAVGQALSLDEAVALALGNN